MSNFFRDLTSCPGFGVGNQLFSHLYDSLNFDIPFVCLFGHLHRKESLRPKITSQNCSSKSVLKITPHNSCTDVQNLVIGGFLCQA